MIHIIINIGVRNKMTIKQKMHQINHQQSTSFIGLHPKVPKKNKKKGNH